MDAQKKTFGALERDEVERVLFRDLARTLPVEKLVIVDESSTHLGMTPIYARAPRGQRAYAKTQRNYGNKVTLLAALRLGGMQAPLVIDAATTTLIFETYIEQVLVPILTPDDVVILDNLAAHKSDKVRCLVEAKGARLLFLPAYSPDLSPIEHAFSKLKQALRRAKARTLEALIAAIAHALTTVTWEDTLGWFTSCGYLTLA
ncbi:MAG: IS630 family transposase [Anaerolineae bacterium]|nr:IS630 family transposase [Anaerolineae bacterium]